jgi:16S rRNA (cytosine967-C5)-methyltransferase
MLDAVLRRGRTLDSAAQGSKLPPADAALALAIAGETLRRLPDLDQLIDSATRQRLPDDSKARMVLRLALAQKAGLGTPDHALVTTALPLVGGGPRRLVHGVLGTLLRRGFNLPEAPALPAAVEERWLKAWGADTVQAARRAIGHRPPLDLSFADLAQADSFPLGVSLAPRHRRITDAGAITELPEFGSGQWWVQDLAASLPARLAPTQPCDVLDLCAAPGGKTMQLAAAGHRVTALDHSESRLARLRSNLDRTGLQADLVTANALDWQAPREFDVVLLDAPCSATGTFRRHPEVLYRARRAVIENSAELQARMIVGAGGMVRPGGTLIYSVCSLEPEEGEAIIGAFLDRHPSFRTDPVREDELPDGVTSLPEGWIRVLPGMLEDKGGLDGFFVARLRRD